MATGSVEVLAVMAAEAAENTRRIAKRILFVSQILRLASRFVEVRWYGYACVEEGWIDSTIYAWRRASCSFLRSYDALISLSELPGGVY